MASLSQLTQVRQQLIDRMAAEEQGIQLLNSVEPISSGDAALDQRLSPVANSLAVARKSFDAMFNHTVELINELSDEIQATAKAKYWNTPKPILDQRAEKLRSDLFKEYQSDVDEVHHVVRAMNSWQFPSLEIGCGYSQFTRDMVAGDPLYLTDVYQELIDAQVAPFADAYQRRVRPYLIDPDMNGYDSLPKNQFGFILAWNVFNYYPPEQLELMLNICHELLRPGGTVFFSFNNCEIPACIRLVENDHAAWMTSSLLQDIVTRIGYGAMALSDKTGTVHWAKLSKSGALNTSRKHQTFGEIISV